MISNENSAKYRTRRRTSSSSSTPPLQTLFFSTLGAALLLFTFLAGQNDCHQRHSSSASFERSRNGDAVSKSLINFKGISSGGTDDNELFIPRLRRNKKRRGGQKNNDYNEEEWGKPIKRPEDWETWGFYDIHNGFKCGAHAKDMNKPLPDMNYWNFMRDIYKQVVDSDAVFEDDVLPTEGYAMDYEEDGKQPYYAQISPGKGRGLFASRDIKKGEIVHDGNKSDIEISTKDYRRFLFALPQKMACDVTEWTWTQQMKQYGPYTIRTAFNISVLMNSSPTPNVMPKDGYSSKFYALRDIEKDEEILTDYKIYPTRYDLVGM